MATLQQTLRGLPQPPVTRGEGGTLQQTGKTLQEATQQVQMQAAPTTPMAAQMIGANPDAAKMAGTPQQLQASLRQASEPAQNLQSTLRRQQSRTDTTLSEQNKLQKSASMQALGGLGDRVTNFISAEMSKLGTAAPVQQQAAQQFQGKDLSTISADLQALRQNPNDMQTMLKVQQALGMDINRQLSPDEINKLYEDATGAIARTGAENIADKLTVNQLVQDPQFGYDVNTLSQLLGVTPDEVAQYSVPQLEAKINEVAAAEFNQSQQIGEQAFSPLAGAAERGLAQQAGRELSTTGIRASEADIGKLTQSIQNADQVTLGGETKTVDEILSDDNISAVIKDYLESPEGSPFRKQLEQQEPELAKFIKDNQAALAEAAANLETGATQFKQIQEQNKQTVSNLFGGIQMDPTIMAELVPQTASLQAQGINPQTVPILAYASKESPNSRRRMASEISSIAADDPTVPEQISQLSEEQLQTLGIGKPHSNWEQMKQYNQKTQDIQQINPKDTNSLIREKYPDVVSMGDYQQRLKSAEGLQKLGLNPGIDTSGVNPATLKQDILNARKYVSIENAANDDLPEDTRQPLGVPQPPAPMDLARWLVSVGKNTDRSVSTSEIFKQLQEYLPIWGIVDPKKYLNTDPNATTIAINELMRDAVFDIGNNDTSGKLDIGNINFGSGFGNL